MNLYLPWIFSRRRVILAIIVDIIIFSAGINYSLNLNNYIQKNIYLSYSFVFIILLIWILINYITSKYDSENKLNSSYLIRLFIKNLLITGLYINTFIIIFKFNEIIYNINYLIISISLLSSIFIVSILYYLPPQRIKPQKWYFLSKNNAHYHKFLKLSLLSRTYCDLKFININDISSITIKGFKGLIISNLELLDKSDLKKIKDLNFQIINTIDWAEINLQRIPPELITNKQIDINLYSKTFIYKIQLVIKEIIEKIFSLILIIIVSPIIFISIILIYKEDQGPVIYSQKRVGLKGKIFNVYKLRTMKVNAEKGKAQWAQSNDPRVTKTGKFLRLTRFDELPQLISVINGNMSLIGPRPERPELDEDLIDQIPYYKERYLLKPGLSGWAQVNYPYGANKKDSENKLSYDLFYIKRFSILFDALIFIKTIKLVFNLEGSIPKGEENV